MTWFDLLKLIHVSCALLSIAGFALRGYWMLVHNPLLQHRLAKTLPHIVDTMLLASAIGMLLLWRLSPLGVDWLAAKIVALLVYIGLGMVALRFGKTRTIKVSTWLLAMTTAIYIVSVAYTKSPMGILGLL